MLTADEIPPRCEICRHWHRASPPLATGTRNRREDPNVGACQLYPPVLAETKWFPVSMFPEVHASRVCGEWEEVYPGHDGGGGGEEIAPDNVVKLSAVA
ncbi:hypothetical protein [Sphingomonas immobilis]|uniref:Uncharacterized protein n=1 Tax=Sphingomonas immobilis TaxID=3063997 RepID=A0ABT9A0T0_9SPHN|nr:hypothetical protein [Sphingomonas sp. CA1-15]MDO7843429.1 hypothetical protein [Sphingomonas sp. CA1-15]